MHVETNGVARIRHSRTGEVFDIEPDELEWEPTGGDERSMGPETIYTASIAHPDLGDLSWELSEYPAGMANHVIHDIGDHKLLEDFDIALIVDPEDADFEVRSERDAEHAPYHLEGDGMGISGEALRNLPPDEQLPYIIDWFYRYYEDPANETPHESREGGYQYIWGGPYDARDELSNEFGSIVSEQVLERAIEEVESDGTLDWAPTSAHPSRVDEGMDYDPPDPIHQFESDLHFAIRALDAGTEPQLGSPAERRARERMRAAFDELAMELPPERPAHGSVGHNNPPLDERLSEDEFRNVREATETVRVELSRDAPNVGVIASATKVLFGVARSVGRRFGLFSDEFAKAFGRSLGEQTGKYLGRVIGGGILLYIFNAVLSVKDWLDIALGFF